MVTLPYLIAFGFLAFALLVAAALIYFRDLFTVHLSQTDIESMSDTALVRAQIAIARADVENTNKTIEGFRVTDEATFNTAIEIVKRVKLRKKDVEDRAEQYLKPLRELMKLVREDSQPVINACDEIERQIKAQCDAYRANIAATRLAAEAEARRLQAAAAPAQEQRAALVAVAQAAVPQRNDAHARDNWQAVIVDQTQVPEVYWTRVIVKPLIDAEMMRQVREAKKNKQTPAPSIPGVVCTNNQTTVIKS